MPHRKYKNGATYLPPTRRLYYGIEYATKNRDSSRMARPTSSHRLSTLDSVHGGVQLGVHGGVRVALSRCLGDISRRVGPSPQFSRHQYRGPRQSLDLRAAEIEFPCAFNRPPSANCVGEGATDIRTSTFRRIPVRVCWRWIKRELEPSLASDIRLEDIGPLSPIETCICSSTACVPSNRRASHMGTLNRVQQLRRQRVRPRCCETTPVRWHRRRS